MRWLQRLLSNCSTWALCLRALTVKTETPTRKAWTPQKKAHFREMTRDLWYHGFDNYMTFAFPMDELKPISCQGQGPDWDDPSNIGFNDVNGNYTMTLIDVLDTFVVLNDHQGFSKGVYDVIDNVSFDVDTKPQLFEATIRVLGGLLSAHMFATTETYGFKLPGYQGQLLDLAQDLADRMLPAFNTPTGLPFARINLRHGVPLDETTQTCTAGAGSLLLEFATLSRLTGNEVYERVAEKAFFAIWERRSELGLVGNTIDVKSGLWTHPYVSGIGAGIDSFYEYALKMYIYTGEDRYLDVYNEAYSSIMKHSLGNDRFFYRAININTAEVAYNHIDSLGAFWPGLQVLGGDLENAIKSHLIYWNLWRRFSGIPETFNVVTREPIMNGYPLRPEFIESTYFLYRATGDPFYLDVGERVLMDLIARSKVDCGLATVSNLLKNESDDRMESFVLSETLKYLYLLFDEENQFNRLDDNFIFTTEGHIMVLPREHFNPIHIPRQDYDHRKHQCLAYRPIAAGSTPQSHSANALRTSIQSRPDVDLARYLVGLDIDSADAIEDSRWWRPEGTCTITKPEIYTTEFIMTVQGQTAKEDPEPDSTKIVKVSDGYVVHDVMGIRLSARTSVDNKGFIATRLGPYEVSPTDKIYFADRRLFADDPTPAQDKNEEITLQIYLTNNTSSPDSTTTTTNSNKKSRPWLTDVTTNAIIATFGHNPKERPPATNSIRRFGRGFEPAPLFRVDTNLYGCDAYKPGEQTQGALIWVLRGECSFMEKLNWAKEANALGVVISSEDNRVQPVVDEVQVDYAKKAFRDVTMMVVTSASQQIETMLDEGERRSDLRVMVKVQAGDEELDDLDEEERRKHVVEHRALATPKPLFIHGKQLQNGILIL